jgi:hypothetical protein
MRAGDGFEIGRAPRDDPFAYPGALPPFSFLVTADGVERLDDGDGGGVDAGPLHDRLSELGAPPMARRRAVLAFGSNRSPAQLVAKFAGRDRRCAVPVLRAQLADLSVVFTAGVALYGSIPASLVVDRGATTEVAVTYLDDEQLAVMDATEGAHHSRPPLAAEHGLCLVGGTEPVPCVRYRSTRPVLLVDGAPVRLAEIGSVGSRLAAGRQLDVQRLLLDVWRGRLEPFVDEHAFVAAVRADRAMHAAANAALASLEADPSGRVGSATIVWPDD